MFFFAANGCGDMLHSSSFYAYGEGESDVFRVFKDVSA